MSNAVLVFALLLLQPIWHLWLAPPGVLPPGLLTAVMLLPLLPPALLMLLRRPDAGFWAGLAALFYFSVGVMEWWTSPDVRWLAALQTFLSVALVVSASWKGLRARIAAGKGRTQAPPAQ